MQPIKITIKGDFYDCQIYRGRLYLWTFNGDLKVYNWNDIVSSFIKKDTDKIAMTFCFLDGNYLYKSSLIELFKDEEFKNLLIDKFNRITEPIFQLTERQLEKFLFGQQDTPTKILPTDTEIYSNKLYFIHEQGLFSSSAHRAKSEKFPVSSKPSKLWDCNLLSIKANKYPQLALSGGNEGLFELNMASSLPSNLKRIEQGRPIFQISEKHSSFSNYSYLNIYNTSLVDKSFLAMFKWNINQEKKPLRDYEKDINDQEIFNIKNTQHFISWGIEDKIYRATDIGFEIIKYNNYTKEEGEERFTRLESINLQEWKGKIINGGTSYFGNIVECENALVVAQSDGNCVTIPGPITRWRVYPRSLNYENHLHVILDDRIEIYSFNHDYFLNQREKKIGIQFTQEKHIQRRVGSYFDNESLFF
ncbi:MAG: hypothetical protein LBE91_14725 [Tannerella sp.]|jgi:hypothetical protein|nr:hypothetical protein [Tannerella sp.]